MDLELWMPNHKLNRNIRPNKLVKRVQKRRVIAVDQKKRRVIAYVF